MAIARLGIRDRRTFFLILVGSAICIFPLIHIFFGSVLMKMSGAFWIQTPGFRASLAIAIGSFAPEIFLFLAIAIFSVLVATIDLHTPLSTRRNYIVLLPAFAIGAAYFIRIAYDASRLIGGLLILMSVIFAVPALIASYEGLQAKTRPYQHWKDAAAFIVEHAAGRNSYYAALWFGELPIRDAVYNFYVDRMSAGRVKMRYSETVPDGPALVFYVHHVPSDFSC